jgi:hypothetical protein
MNKEGEEINGKSGDVQNDRRQPQSDTELLRAGVNLEL